MIIFDTETTGLPRSGLMDLSKQPQIIEFAAIKLDDATLEEVERIEFFANPGKLLPPKITEITGIKDLDLVDAEPFANHFNKLCKFWFEQKYSFAHNHSFDSQMMIFELRRLKKQYKFPWTPVQICTVNATYSMKGYRLKLQALHEHLFGEEFKGAHRAMTDVEALTRIVKELLNRQIIKII